MRCYSRSPPCRPLGKETAPFRFKLRANASGGRKLITVLCLFGTLTSVWANIPGGGTGTGANVTVVDNGDGTVTMANGVVSIHVVKNGASINQINYTYNNGSGSQTPNLLAGGKNGGTFYWEFGGWGGSSWAYSLVTNNGSYAEIDLKCDSATNGLVDIHFSMLRGSPGFYATPIWSHRPQDAAMGTGEERDNIYIAPYFNWMSVNDQVQREEGLNATYAPAFYSPQENSLVTGGVDQGTYEDKYKWSADLGVERVWGWSSVSDANHGATGKNVGIWHIVASSEFYNGGPLKPDLNDAPMVNMINGGHYYFGNDSGFAAGESWTRVSGPYFIYVNSVTNTLTDPVQTSQALYADAKAQAAAEVTAWPYAWMNNTNYASASQRGTVTGKIAINDTYNPNASASNLWVGVVQQPSVTINNVYDFQLWMKPYQFWVKSDANGNFTIPNVIAGSNYTLYAFGPGASGMFMSKNQTGGNPGITYALPVSPFTVVVAGGATNNLGTVTWSPARVGPTVFEIGYPTRKGDKFRHGDDYWVGDVGPSPTAPSPVWDKFMEFPYDFPNGLNYVVGQSRWNTDWNYAQSVYPDSSGNSITSSSTVTFNLASAPVSGATASLMMGIASDDNSPIYVTVNGTLLSGGNATGTPQTSLPTTGWFPINDISDSNIREENHGGYSDERLTFAGSLLHAGNNTINFSFRQAGGSGFTHHFMYDYIRLEMTGYVPPAPASVSAYPGSNSVLLSWPVKPGATSYNVLRSTVSGSGYTQIASNVVGPVSGSGPGNATYVDSTATNGTTYYYVVQSVNPIGISANSPQSSAVTPLAAAGTQAPATPTGVTATAGVGSVALSWNAATGANYYTVQRSTLTDKIPDFTTSTVVTSNQTVLSTVTLNNSVTGTSFTDTNVSNGTKYAYTVQASSAAGTSGTSTPYVAKPLAAAPSTAPTGVTATPGAQQVMLNWSAVPGAIGYIVQVATTPGGPYTFVTSVSTLNYTQGSQADNKTYYYIITATTSGGVSGDSATISALTGPSAPAVTTTAGNTQVQLTWPASTGATSYKVQRGTATGSYTSSFTTTGPSFIDSGLTNGTTYYYVVSAGNAAGTFGPVSTEASSTPVTTVPVAATNLTASAGNTQVVLNWTAVSGATSYTLKRGTVSGGPYATTVATGLTSTTFTNTGLTNGTTYYYVLIAVNSGGSSAYSSQASATPLPPIPAVPTGLAATAGNAQVSLTWTAVSGATSYIVSQASTNGGSSTLLATNLTSPAFIATGLTNGQSYYYVVAASNLGGTSANSTVVSAKPVQTFAQWIAAAFPGGSASVLAAGADPDQDGYSNLLEYFLGTQPGTANGVSAITCTPDGAGHLIFNFRMAKNLTGVSYTIQQSTDLITWANTGIAASILSDQGTYYQMQALVTLNANPSLYLRLSVTPGG